MKKKFNLIALALIVLVLLGSAALPALAEHDGSHEDVSTYDQLKVSYWPEHDSQSVLLIFRGLFPSDVKLPATVKIYIPKGARVSSTAAVGSNGQYQYNEAWNSHVVTPGEEDYDVLTFTTTNPEFQAEIYYNTIGTEKVRDLDLKFKTAANINNLSVEIEKPVGATEFKAEPVSSDVQTVDKYEYHNYSFSNIPAEREFSYKATYSKDNNTPSENSQPGQVNTTGGTTAAAGDSSRTNTIIAIVFILGVIATAIMVGVWRVRTASSGPSGKQYKSSQYASKPKAKAKSKPKPKPKAQKFCSDCGESLEPGAKFCGSCGEKT